MQSMSFNLHVSSGRSLNWIQFEISKKKNINLVQVGVVRGELVSSDHQMAPENHF